MSTIIKFCGLPMEYSDHERAILNAGCSFCQDVLDINIFGICISLNKEDTEKFILDLLKFRTAITNLETKGFVAKFLAKDVHSVIDKLYLHAVWGLQKTN